MVSPNKQGIINLGNSGIIRLKKKAPLPLRVATSPKTTLALGATLGALLVGPAAIGAAALAGARAAPKLLLGTPKRAITTLVTAPTVAGILAKSPKARGIAKGVLDPRQSFARGEGIAKFVEDPSKATSSIQGGNLKEKVVSGLKTAGLVGGAAAVVGGGAVAGKKLVEKFKGSPVMAGPPAPALAALPVSQTDFIPTVTGTGQSVARPAEVVAPVTPQLPTIKITNKPVINVNIRQSKSKKFINQHNVIRK